MINTNKILSSGYCYLIDSNSSVLISHPNQSPACPTIQCAEGFSISEYSAFQTTVLNPVRFTGDLSGSSVIYKKQGKLWRLTASTVTYGTIKYTVFATVPNSEIEKTSTDTTNSINLTVRTMTIVFAVCIFTFLVILVAYSRVMVTLIVNPVNDIRAAFLLIRNDDLTLDVPTKASSSDMKVLLEAFSKVCFQYTRIVMMMVSHSYTRCFNAVADCSSTLRERVLHQRRSSKSESSLYRCTGSIQAHR